MTETPGPGHYNPGSKKIMSLKDHLLQLNSTQKKENFEFVTISHDLKPHPRLPSPDSDLHLLNRDSSGSMERGSNVSSPKRAAARIGKVRFMDRYPTQILQVKISKKSKESLPGPGSYDPVVVD